MQIAIDLDTAAHVHVCETNGQFLQGRKLFGTSVVAHLDENGISITDVMIDGRWVIRDRGLTTIDEPRLYAEARDLRAEMVERLERQSAGTHAIVPS